MKEREQRIQHDATDGEPCPSFSVQQAHHTENSAYRGWQE
jgi:hypothetical protein